MNMKYDSIRRFFYKTAAVSLIAACVFGSLPLSSQAKRVSKQETMPKKDVANGTLEQEEFPDIIAVMNESFFDPSVLGNFSVNEDYLPFFHSLEEYTGTESDNILKGTLHVSDIGGTSTNAEFEFLTGNSMAFLSPRVSPYSRYLNADSEYLPALFRQAGYKTAALYPYKGSSWNRNLAYSMMGFSESHFQDSFDSTQMIRDYISDKAVYEKALQICEETEAPVFAFCSTIQNHSGYQKSYSNFTPAITVRDGGNPSLNQYLSLLRESDEALQYLIERVSASDSKTLVVFFGNHQPNDYVVESICDSAEPSSNSSSDIRYTVPYFLWANFDLSGYEMEDTSPSLLGNTVVEAAGIEPNEFQEFLSRFKEIVPAISSQGYLDRDGNFYSLPSSSPARTTEASEELYSIRLYQTLTEDAADTTH